MFEAKPIWKRMIVILAGVTMNALFAWLLFTFLAAKNGRQIDPVTTVGRVVDELLPPEAAAFKSIRPGTRIVSVNGQARGVVGRDRGRHRQLRRSPRSGFSWTTARW